MKELNRRSKVVVAMSGGVDSSVAAALMKEVGFEVVGAHMVCWQGEEDRSCSASQEQMDAARVAVELGIEFETWDLTKAYKKRVFDYMIKGYEAGVTPNPDVRCNSEIKFGVFFEEARKRGAELVATGHYARIKNGQIAAGIDKSKDQSYFLWRVNKEKIPFISFPVGEFKKSEVRKMAKELKISVADKKDSQGLCFVGKIDFQDFLRERLPAKEGKIINRKGEVVGRHQGTHFYTIGQRHDLGVFGGSGPYYVVQKDKKNNQLIVVERGDEISLVKKVEIDEINQFREVRVGEKLLVRVRYRQPLKEVKRLKIQGGKGEIEFEQPIEFVAEGQSAVVYDEEEKIVLGGVIRRLKKE